MATSRTPRYAIEARWDADARVWWATSPDIPELTTEAATIEALVERVLAVLPEIVTLPAGAEVEFHAARAEHLAPVA